MPEVPHASKHHGQSQPIRGLNHFLIPYRPSGLHHADAPASRRFFHAIREGEECVRGNHGSFQRVLQLARLGGAQTTESTRLIWPAPTPTSTPSRA